MGFFGTYCVKSTFYRKSVSIDGIAKDGKEKREQLLLSYTLTNNISKLNRGEKTNDAVSYN